MYELKKLNLKQSEKYMTYKCNEYGKHYKKFSRIIPVVVIITLVAAFLVPTQSKVIYALGVAITAGLFFMVYSYYKQMVNLKEVPTVPCEYVVTPVKYNERVQLKTTKGDNLLFAFVEKSRSIYKNEKEALIIYVPETGHIYGEHVALLKDIKGQLYEIRKTAYLMRGMSFLVLFMFYITKLILIININNNTYCEHI